MSDFDDVQGGHDLDDLKRMASHAIWHHRKRLPMNKSQREWFRGNQSLTKQLMAYSEGEFELKLINEYQGKPFMHEARALGLDLHRGCRIREVMLHCLGQETVFARSIISDQAIRASKHQLTKLGTIPLGHLLFKQANVNLETRQVAKIGYGDMGSDSEKRPTFARRTLYQLNSENILVTEFFLQAVWEK